MKSAKRKIEDVSKYTVSCGYTAGDGVIFCASEKTFTADKNLEVDPDLSRKGCDLTFSVPSRCGDQSDICVSSSETAESSLTIIKENLYCCSVTVSLFRTRTAKAEKKRFSCVKPFLVPRFVPSYTRVLRL